MSQRLLRGFVVIATFSLAVPMAAAPQAMAAEIVVGGMVSAVAQYSPEVADRSVGAGTATHGQTLAEYWTSERMRSAEPVKMAIAGQPKQVAPKTFSQLRTKPYVVPSSAPKIAPVSSIRPTIAPVPNGAMIGPTATGSPTISTVPNIFDPTMGKVFFTDANGDPKVCSASVVTSKAKSLVCTAGHCVAGGTTWHRNWMFVPGYNDGTFSSYAPYGRWFAKTLNVAPGWFGTEQLHNDVGAVVVHPDSLGRKLQDVVGANGIVFGKPIGYTYAYGYPADLPFNGEVMWLTYGQASDNGNSIIYMASLLNGGSSGGAWLSYVSEHNAVYINGHNSYMDADNYPGRMHSPYYGAATANFYNSVNL